MRYYFDVASPKGLASDHEGQEFETDSEAVSEAVLAARELASERILQGEPLRDWAIVIRSDEGSTVRTLRLAEIVHGSPHG